jgi:hypothetical protein
LWLLNEQIVSLDQAPKSFCVFLATGTLSDQPLGAWHTWFIVEALGEIRGIQYRNQTQWRNFCR